MNVSQEESVLLDLLGLSVIGKVSVRKESKQFTPEFKVIKGFVKCKLCGTRSIQLIQMEKTADGVWLKRKELPIDDVKELSSMPFEEYSTEVRLCGFCRDTLSLKEKSELIDMIINLYNPILSRQEIWKHIKKLKEINEAEKELR